MGQFNDEDLGGEFINDAQNTIDDVTDAVNAARDVKNGVDKIRDAIKASKQASSAAQGAAGGGAAAGAGAAAAGAAGAAAGAAGAEAAGAAAAAGAASAAVIGTPVLIVVGIILLVLIIIVVMYMVLNSGIFNILLKMAYESALEDAKTRLYNTVNDPSDWRFQYNKMLPEEQYDYIYNGNDPYSTGEGNEVEGLKDYILKAYLAFKTGFIGEMGDIDLYQEVIPDEGAKVTSIDQYRAYIYGNTEESIEALDTSEWYAQLANDTLSVVQDKFYSSGTAIIENSDIYNKGYVDAYLKYVQGSGADDLDLANNGKYFNYYDIKTVYPGASETVGTSAVEILTGIYVLNLDLTLLANYEVLTTDMQAAANGKIIKSSQITSVINYLIAGMDIATCNIAPAKGYLDFLSKTIGNSEVFQLALFEGGLFKDTADVTTDVRIPTFSVDADGNITYDKDTILAEPTISVSNYLDNDIGEVVRLEGTGTLMSVELGGVMVDVPVYEYYVKVSQPVDTDRLLWAMFVSDTAKTNTYSGIFDKTYAAYQGTYYEAYMIFEPTNVELSQANLLQKIGNFIWSLVKSIDKNTAFGDDAIIFAKKADKDEIRRFLYGLSYDESHSSEYVDYFQKTWNEIESIGDYSDSRYANLYLLKHGYLVDKDNSGTIDGYDFTGLMNEAYYSYTMRILYTCDSLYSIASTAEGLLKCHNTMHDGVGVSLNLRNSSEIVSTPCLFHRIFNLGKADGSCASCLRKNGVVECGCENSGVGCMNWASDLPAACPGCDGDSLTAADTVSGTECDGLAQRAGTGRVKFEYIRDPEPEFTDIISISESDYINYIDNDAKPNYVMTLSASGPELEGNPEVELDTDYNRQGYGNNNTALSTYIGSYAPESSALNGSNYYFSAGEFYAKYALNEEWVDSEGNTVTEPPADDNTTGWDDANSDLIELTPNKEEFEKFTSLQTIASSYNRELWQNWAQAVTLGETDAVANYRAVSIMSAIMQRKYYYHNLLNVDSYEAGYYDEDNGYKIPLSQAYSGEVDADGNPVDKADYKKWFDNNVTSSEEENTAFYGRDVDEAERAAE